MLDECDEYGRLPGVDSASNGRTAVASPPWLSRLSWPTISAGVFLGLRPRSRNSPH